ncbi:MAG: biotin--[acetyl-CoA-carboxylase] ligase, partial [Burkholderiaceae bacterium]
ADADADGMAERRQDGAWNPGALTFSLSLPLIPQTWSGLSLAVGVSVANSLHARLRIKWPNDLWLDDRKLAGILIETASLGDSRVAVIGVGINIRQRPADGLSTAPAWLHELLPELDAPTALLRIVPDLARTLRTFEALGFAPFEAAFRARDALHGRAVVLSDGTSGTAAGVDSSGALRVHTLAGMKAILSAEVSVRPAGN